MVSGCCGGSRVYPRVGGGNSFRAARYLRDVGLSPRGRGKPVVVAVHVEPWGSIPAWAGETSLIFAIHCASPVYPRVGGGN